MKISSTLVLLSIFFIKLTFANVFSENGQSKEMAKETIAKIR